MRRPYYLGIRSLDLFVSALHDVDREVLRSLLAEAAAGKPHALDPRKVRLVEAELSRRKTADGAGMLAVIVSLLGLMSVLIAP